jgi:hypothetical protein
LAAGLGARAADAAICAWYLLLTALATGPILVDPRNRIPDVPLDPLFQAAVLERMSQNLLRLDFANLWDGGFFYPAERTLAMSDSLVALQPLALPLRLILGDPVLVSNLLLILTFPLAAAAADVLARVVTRSRMAAWICGTAFAFAAYRFAHIGHLNLLQMWALPLAFLTLELLLRRGGWRAAWAWAAVHVFVAGNALNYLLMLAILEPLWLAVRVAVDPGRRRLFGRLRGLVLPGAAAAVVIAALLLPYFQLRGAGYERRPIDTFDFSARLTDYFRPADEALLLGDLFANSIAGVHERAVAPGFALVVLAAIGVVLSVAQRRRARAWWRCHAPWLALGIGAFALSFGPRLWPNARGVGSTLPTAYPLLPFAVLDTFLPLESLRSPARFAVLVLLALALVAGATAARLWRSHAVRRGRGTRAVLVALTAAAMLGEYAARVDTLPAHAATEQAAVYEWLRRQPPGPVVELPTSRPDRYLLASTVDGHPRLNGWSGFVPRQSENVNLGLVRYGVTPEEGRAWVEHASRLGARYLVVHWPDITSPTRAMLQAHIRAGSIRPLEQFRNATVYAVSPFEPPDATASASSSKPKSRRAAAVPVRQLRGEAP